MNLLFPSNLFIFLLNTCTCDSLLPPPPSIEVDRIVSNFQELQLLVGSLEDQNLYSQDETFKIERKGAQGRLALRKCSNYGQSENCPYTTNTIFFGSIYSFWIDSTTPFNCSFPAQPYERTSRYCYMATETSCHSSPGWVDESGLGCSWYEAAPLRRCPLSEGAITNCCICQGGTATGSLSVCANEGESTCKVDNTTFTLQGGAWVYYGVLVAPNTGVQQYTCGPPYQSTPFPSYVQVDAYCYYLDTSHFVGWSEIATTGYMEGFIILDSLVTALMLYSYRATAVAGSVAYYGSSIARNYYAAQVPSIPIVGIAQGSMNGRITFAWESPSSLLFPLYYRLYLDMQVIADRIYQKAWTVVDCIVGRYYQFNVVAVSPVGESFMSKPFGRFCGNIPGKPTKPALIKLNCSDPITPSVTIKWEPPQHEGIQAITGYKVLRASEPKLNDFVVIDPISGVGREVREFEDRITGGLYYNKAYRYSVVAMNDIDNSDYSNASIPLSVLCN